MAKPAVSVIIPTHNRLGLLRQALDSVAAQTFTDLEVIVIDDASDEAVEPGVRGHRAGPRVLRQTACRGPAAARNRGLQEAAADTVAFLDSDDLWQPTKLERFMRALDADDSTDIYYGPMQPIDIKGRVVPGRTKPCHAGRIAERLFCSSFVHVPTVVCRKTLLEQYGGFDESLPVCEDYDLWLRISLDHAFGLVEEPLALRRLHNDRLSKAHMSRNLSAKAHVLCRFGDLDAARAQLHADVAARRLARVCFIAGRAAFRDGRFRHAAELCRRSRAYGGSIARTALVEWPSRGLQHFFDRPEAFKAPVSPAGEAVST